MNDCAKKCMKNNANCEIKTCRLWIDYKEDLNCANISISKCKQLTLSEVAERLNVSIVRIKQIQDTALSKIQKKGLLKLC